MSGPRHSITDEALERALIRKATRPLDPRLLEVITANAAATPQVHRWRGPSAGTGTAIAWIIVAGIVTLAGVAFAAAGIGRRPPDLGTVTTPSVEAPSVVQASPSRQSECATAFDVRTGAAMSPTDTPEVTLGSLGAGLGVYEVGTDPSGVFAAEIWRVRGSDPTSRRIATVSGDGLNLATPIDASADGSDFLLLAGRVVPLAEQQSCVDLYRLVVKEGDPTDVERLTSMLPGQVVTDAAYSPERDRIAYAVRCGQPTGAVLILDVATSQTTESPGCEGQWSGDLEWSPDGRRIAVRCGQDILVLDTSSEDAEVRVGRSLSVLAFTWTDDRHLEVASVTSSGPGGLRVESIDVVAGQISDTWAVQDEAIDWLTTSYGAGTFSPDAKRIVLRAWTTDPDGNGSQAGFLVDAVGGLPTEILSSAMGPLGWSPDGAYLYYEDNSAITDDPSVGRLTMTRLELASGSTLTITELPSWTLDGVWRLP